MNNTKTQQVTVNYIQELKPLKSISLKGEKLEHLKTVVENFQRKRFKQNGEIEAVKSIDLVTAFIL